MTSNLKELKDKLYEAFDEATEWQRSNNNWSNSADRNLSRTENRKAMAQLAQAIVVVETKLEERERGLKDFGLKD